ncbi:MAG: YhbY family RNA-binding protein [Deltaproteobacteria bacterium]|nr:YhbY family RNA-binding protein [Deltaproteobacteria bacterium]
MLTSKQRAFLRALAHDKKPVILLGHKGVTEPVVKETAGALKAHELIKVRLGEGDAGKEEARALVEGTGAELIAITGRIAILYKAHPEPDKRKVQLPKAKKKTLFEVTED